MRKKKQNEEAGKTAEENAGDDQAGPGPSSTFQNRKSLLPLSWQRLQHQVTGRTDVPLPSSGANVTLRDLARETQRHLEMSGAESDVPSSSGNEDDVGDGRPKPVTGWLGTPDPRKFARGTNRLSPAELEQEQQAGNVVAFSDLNEAIKQLQPWEQKMLYYEVLADYTKNRMFVELDTSDSEWGTDSKDAKGKSNVVSLWELYRYVHHNPELEALAKSHRQVIDGPEDENDTSGRRRTPPHLAPFTGEPGNPYAMDLPPEVVKELPWILVAQGDIWKRRPTRWLKGLDGKRDFSYGVYVHEDMAHQLLGPKYAGLNPQRVASSEEYWKDVLQAGPQLGMTYMLAAARDVPVAEASKSWSDKLASRLQARGLDTVNNPPLGLHALSVCLSPSVLHSETRLLTAGGSHLREGSTLFITALPKGNVILHAMTADPVATREYYSLGVFKDEAVRDALGSLFLGGPPGRLEQEPPLDEQVLRQAPRNILMAAQGIKMGAHTQPTGIKPPPPVLGSAAFKLPPLGSKHQDGVAPYPPTLVSDISQDVAQMQLLRVFREASDAAQAAAPPGPGAEAAAARRQAAERVLQQGLGQLGIDIQGLNLLRGGDGNGELLQQEGSGSDGSGGWHQGQLMQAMGSQQQQQQQNPEGVFGATQPLSGESLREQDVVQAK